MALKCQERWRLFEVKWLFFLIFIWSGSRWISEKCTRAVMSIPSYCMFVHELDQLQTNMTLLRNSQHTLLTSSTSLQNRQRWSSQLPHFRAQHSLYLSPSLHPYRFIFTILSPGIRLWDCGETRVHLVQLLNIIRTICTIATQNYLNGAPPSGLQKCFKSK